MAGYSDDCIFPSSAFFITSIFILPVFAIFVHKIDYLNLKFTASMNFYPCSCVISLPNFTELIKISIFFMSQYFHKNNLQKYHKTVSYLNANSIAVTFSAVSTAIHNQLAINKITRKIFLERDFVIYFLSCLQGSEHLNLKFNY